METSNRPFEGIKIVDTTHVLAGPFASYQMALLGADVIKVEHPDDPDQTREQGADIELRSSGMATTYLAQAANKRCMTLNLKTKEGARVFKQLVAESDVLVENYRPGAFEDLELGYEALSALNPALIYCSISAFGQTGPRSSQTAYDLVIQAASGLMAHTGTPEANPIRIGSPVVDYATGTSGAFAIASALYHRNRTGLGQRIDLSMFDVSMILMGAQITSFTYGGHVPRPMGNSHFTATIACYETLDGLLMLAAANHRQQARLWRLLGRPDMIKTDEGERLANRQHETRFLTEIFLTRTADEWESHLQRNHVPAARVRPMTEALRDPQLEHRNVLYGFDGCDGVESPFTVPVAAFEFSNNGPRIDTAPRKLGADTASILASLGYSADDISDLKQKRVI
jgi:crotonobetainyl-CoA:carnitine CoA-transferase CaiB-like acyl-CoA transferase